MRLIFAGTPDFARVALAQLHAQGHAISLVLTQPDRPAGRGMRLQASPVKEFAVAHGLAVAQPRGLRLDGRYAQDAAAAQTLIQQADADAMVVAAYGLILPRWVLGTPRLGCLNIHASLLPRWRGAAPIHRAIEAGDRESGVTIMQMDEGLDTGDMLLAEAVAIHSEDTTGSLHDRLAELGARMIVETLRQAERGELQPRRQPDVGVSYAHKIDKREAVVDWSLSAALIERRIRAFNPAPGAVATLGGESFKLWAARALPAAESPAVAPGTILSVGNEAVTVRCGEGLLQLTQLQRAGARRLALPEFLRGFPLLPGMAFGAKP